MTKDIYLVRPKLSDEKEILKYRQEFIDNGETMIPGASALFDISNFKEWFKRMKLCEKEETMPQANYVPAIQYLLKRREDGKILGTLQIRTKLNDHLFNFGGNFGGSIRPSERKKGYSTRMILLGLKLAKKMGFDKILITCEEHNIGSEKSILKAGGIYEDKRKFEKNGKTYKRFWIKI